ncbi:MAG: DUF917 domain-containing protein [Verrucomicrobia bacterium]|nr:DUF917 domain-containing protein [Verrucomicrobiota bacterium]
MTVAATVSQPSAGAAAEAAAKQPPATTAASAPRIRTLSEQEVADLMLGSSIQATRNSDTASMIKRAKGLMAQGRHFRIVEHGQVPDGWNVICAAGAVGGGGAWEHVPQRIRKQNLPAISVEEGTLRAMDVLGRHLGVRWDAVISNEASHGRIGAFVTAATRGLPVVDGCLALRCKPEVQIQIPTVMGVGNKPTAIVSRWGDQIIFDRPAEDHRIEDVARAIAVASGGVCSIARTPLTGREVKLGTIPGALTQAIAFGRAVREAGERGQDPIAALIGVSGGMLLFQGTVRKAEMSGLRGHSYWDVEIAGEGAFSGHLYKVWVKNENLIAWLDGRVDAMPPDLICNLNPKTGDAITGAGLGGYRTGESVAMVGIPAHPMWRLPKGIEIFGPRHFDYDLDYVPIEELRKRRPPALGGGT